MSTSTMAKPIIKGGIKRRKRPRRTAGMWWTAKFAELTELRRAIDRAKATKAK